jgi:hypothetical protein
MGKSYDPKLKRGNFILEEDEDYGPEANYDPSLTGSTKAQRDACRKLLSEIKLKRDPGELALLQPEARAKVRDAVRDARRVLEINDPTPRMDLEGEPVAYGYRHTLSKIPTPVKTPNGLSKNTLSSLQHLGLDEHDPFPSRGTLAKILALYRQSPWTPKRDANIKVLEEAIGWNRERRSSRQVLVDEMNSQKGY